MSTKTISLKNTGNNPQRQVVYGYHILMCCRGDSPAAELVLFRDFIRGIITLARDERGEHTRGCQANPKPHEDHKLSSVVAAQRRNRIPGHKARHQEEIIPTHKSKHSSLQSPIYAFQRQNSKHFPAVGCRTEGALLCHVPGKQDVAGANTNPGCFPLPPCASSPAPAS